MICIASVSFRKLFKTHTLTALRCGGIPCSVSLNLLLKFYSSTIAQHLFISYHIAKPMLYAAGLVLDLNVDLRSVRQIFNMFADLSTECKMNTHVGRFNIVNCVFSTNNRKFLIAVNLIFFQRLASS